MTQDLEKQNSITAEKTELSSAVLARIKNECVVPAPKWRFMCAEYSMWVLWGLSVFFGSIAFAVIIFFLLNAGFTVYEATHDDVLSLFLDTAPLWWVCAFALMAVLAHFNLRHTKCGYRYTVLRVLISSIVFSFMGGLVLHAIGIGLMVDDFLSKKLPMIPALSHMEQHIWQNPHDGRMEGVYSGQTQQENIVLFTDINGVVWELSTQELGPKDTQYLLLGKTVHLLGLASTTVSQRFHGCMVLPKKRGVTFSFSEFKKERAEFLQRLQEHRTAVGNELQENGTLPEFITKPLCAEHKAVLRVPF